jgi:hypothetical protein
MAIRICGDNTVASPAITSASDTDTGLQFGTNEVKVVNGNLDITDGNLIVAAGHGIDFSNDTNAAGTTNELFDDYEEGVYTPVFSPMTSGSITLQPSWNTYSYERVGNVVHVHGRVRLDSVSSPTGALQVSLPFARQSVGEDADRLTGLIFIQNAAANIAYYGIHPTHISTVGFDICRTNSTGAVVSMAQDFSGDELVGVNITYRAA